MNGSEGEAVYERVDYHTARVLFLQMIQEWLERDEKPHPNPDALEIHREDLERFGKAELGWNEHETSRLLKGLVDEGFISPYPDEDNYILELDHVIHYAWVADLTDKCRTTIGVLEDPSVKLNEVMDALVEAMRTVEGVSQERKEQGEKAAEELRTFVRGLAPGAALEVLKALAATMGIPIP